MAAITALLEVEREGAGEGQEEDSDQEEVGAEEGFGNNGGAKIRLVDLRDGRRIICCARHETARTSHAGEAIARVRGGVVGKRHLEEFYTLRTVTVQALCLRSEILQLPMRRGMMGRRHPNDQRHRPGQRRRR